MKKIYINPGHSDKDPGAVGYETERKLNEAVCQHMDAHLQAHYLCETRMNPGTMDSLSEICRDANSWGADLFVILTALVLSPSCTTMPWPVTLMVELSSFKTELLA